MKGRITIREIIMFGVCLFLSYFLYVKESNKAELEADKIRAEERIKMYEDAKLLQQQFTDSLLQQNNSLQAVLEYQKQNPKIIIEKYDKIRDNISVLNAGESISYLSGRLSQAGGN